MNLRSLRAAVQTRISPGHGPGADYRRAYMPPRAPRRAGEAEPPRVERWRWLATWLLEAFGLVRPAPRRAAPRAPAPPRSDGPAERFGDRAVRLGFVTDAEVEDALREQRRNAADSRPLGGVLLGSGALSSSQLARVLEELAPGYRLSPDAVRIANILHLAIANGQKTFLFAGVQERAAADLVVSGTALALALMDHGSLVLADCDAEQPSLHRHFALKPGPGVLALMSGRMNTAEPALHGTGLPSLDILLMEQSAAASGLEFLDEAKSARLLDLGRTRRALLLLAPPLLTHPETLALASRVDATLLVSAAESARGAELFDAERMLASANANTLGVVVSRMKS